MKFMKMGLINLLEESPEGVKNIGKKGVNLAILAKNNIIVPKSYAINNDFYKKFIDDLKPKMSVILKSNNFENAYSGIKKLFLTHSLSSDLEKKLVRTLNSFPKDTRLAVRSSGMSSVNGEYVVEDSKNNSLAGQYDSYLNVSKKKVGDAIKLCWASLFNERTLKSFDSKFNETYLDSKMSVVLQEMILADKSAVMMTRDPIDERNVLGVESTYGPCEGLVSGGVEGDLILYDRDNKNIVLREIGAKENKIIYEEFSRNKPENICFKENSENIKNTYSLTNIQLECLIKSGRRRKICGY